MVQPGRYDRPVTHYDLLRTLQDMYGLSPIGAKPITDLWKPRQKKEKEDIPFHHLNSSDHRKQHAHRRTKKITKPSRPV
jgi:hypothetical protein